MTISWHNIPNRLLTRLTTPTDKQISFARHFALACDEPHAKGDPERARRHCAPGGSHPAARLSGSAVATLWHNRIRGHRRGRSRCPWGIDCGSGWKELSQPRRGEWAVAGTIISRTARATKCRAADDLLTAAEFHPSLETGRQQLWQMPATELRAARQPRLLDRPAYWITVKPRAWGLT
jgi:hypothetical protein